MRGKRGAVILAAISAALLAVSLGYFGLTPGAWASLNIESWTSSLLQTTADEPADGKSAKDNADTGSTDKKAKKSGKTASSNADAAKNDGNAADANKSDDSADANASASSGASGGKASGENGGVSGSGVSGSSGSAGSGASSSGSNSDGSGSNSGSGSGTAPSTPEAPAPDNTVTVTVSVSSSAVGSPVSASGTYTFDKGATAYDALCALGLSVNASSTSMGIYVAAIGGLAEKEHGSTSGWMYSVNGSQPNYSAGGYALHDGDSVSWYYVTG